ncbi:MAG: DUF3426 domain-containing protein [Kiloniellaceae bacterium]
MIVSCPACEIRFQVDESQLGPDGRIVRCGKCGNCWHLMPEDDPRAGLAAAAAAPPRPRPGPPVKKKRRGVLVGWVLLLLLVGGVAAGGWFERERIVTQFPQLADVYALIGVPITKPGPTLQLSNVTLESEVVGGDTVITVRGMVANISDHKQPVPVLRAQLTNAAGEAVAEWTFESPRNELDAGGSVTFQTETRNPPQGAQNLSITFAGAQAPAAH